MRTRVNCLLAIAGLRDFVPAKILFPEGRLVGDPFLVKGDSCFRPQPGINKQESEHASEKRQYWVYLAALVEIVNRPEQQGNEHYGHCDAPRERVSKRVSRRRYKHRYPQEKYCRS